MASINLFFITILSELRIVFNIIKDLIPEIDRYLKIGQKPKFINDS